MDRLSKEDLNLLCDLYKQPEDAQEYVIHTAAEELKRYRDLEEQGRLIELPCAVGQEAYAVIRAMKFTETGRLVPNPIIRTITPVSLQDCWRMRQDVGMSVFLTKEEAEAKLKELEGDKE